MAIAVCVLLAVVQGPSGSSSGAARVSAAAGWTWYKTDPHVHSTFSADAFSDIGIHAVAAKAQGYNALFLTDHDGGSSFLINNETANHRVFEDKLTNWTAATFGTQSSSTNALVTSPVASGTSSLHLASASTTYGETSVWSTRGPNFRSGDIILKVKIYPKRIDANSGVYVSASIGGDLNVVKFPKGYTTADGVTSPAKTTVLVWQLGNARVASSDPNTRVITNTLGSYTLNQWNSYTINVTQAMAAIPAADRPLSYDAFTYLRMVAAGNGGTADAYFDTYSIDASGPIPPADEFVYRTPLVGAYDTSTFKIFSSYEMGQSKHSQRFNFAITSPAEYVHYANGIDGIRPTQDMGYPAQLNHPGTGTTIPEAIAGRGLGADTIEVTNPDWEAAWDEILKQGTQILGAYSSDTHSGESANSEATFIYAPALTFDDLIHSYYEGRSYSAVNSFPGRLIFNLDGSTTEPYPARYPVYVPSTQTTRSVHLAVTDGLVSGNKVRWIRNGTVVATDSTTGSSYDATKTMDLTGNPTYVRAEVLNGAGDVVAVTQPIFFRDVSSLPTGMAASVDQVVTTSGRGYNRILTQGITAAAFDGNANRLDLTFVNPPNADARALLATPSAPSSIAVNSAPVDPVGGEAEFNAAQGSSWYYDSASSIVHLKVRQPDSTSPTSTAAVAVSFGGGGGGGGGSTTVTITTDADAKVQSANPTTNYATSTLAVDG
ncbi:MAG: PHP domain-containing protein, partial [Ilumatobacteraceae bacterium]|nr:PHP domain-containing protein [Ilumatobacteraceae bacterium]